MIAALLAAVALALPPLPAHLPHTLQLGLSQPPGDTRGPCGFRYQYLAGGVDTGHGWATWNPDGSFASMYVQDSWAHGKIPVFSYYMLLRRRTSPTCGTRRRWPRTGTTCDRGALRGVVGGPVPLGNTSLPDTWGRYRDNRAQWLLGGSRAHLAAYAKAGVVAFLFGAGADGATTEKTDGGYFLQRAAAYYRGGPLRLPS